MTTTIASGGTLGPTLDATNLAAVLRHVFDANALAPNHGELPTPVCIWGPHGIGKTALVRELTRSRGWDFVEISPAQIEELGDLHGLPTRLDGGTGDAKDGRTGFLPPTWVPQSDGPGILLLDDLNRGDERVVRALMQLLQTHRLYSWTLPAGWQIVATCNPDNGSYSVTPMDDAILTRMVHFTLSFDAKVWTAWARDAGIDRRCIEFVTTYPEAVLGRRTTPRTLVQLFRLLAPITDFNSARELVSRLAHATLDGSTAASFVSFVCVEQRQLATATDILDALTPADALKLIVNAATDHTQGGRLRIDRVGLVIARLEEVIEAADYTPGPRHSANLTAVLASNEVPRDMAMRLHRALARRGLGHLVRDRTVAKRLLPQGAS